MSGELVGNPGEYNPQRREGEISVDAEGVQAALNALSTDGTVQDDRSPSPAGSGAQSTPDGDRKHVSTITQPPPIECPVESCDYSHPSSSGLCAHIGGKQDYNHNWDRIVISAADIHELDDRGFHPNGRVRSLLYGDDEARIGTDDYLAVESVRAYLVWEDLPISKIQVYIDPRYASVQIQPRAYLGDDWDAYKTLMQETDGIHYDWDTQRNYATGEFVNGLNPRELGVKLEADK